MPSITTLSHRKEYFIFANWIRIGINCQNTHEDIRSFIYWLEQYITLHVILSRRTIIVSSVLHYVAVFG